MLSVIWETGALEGVYQLDPHIPYRNKTFVVNRVLRIKQFCLKLQQKALNLKSGRLYEEYHSRSEYIDFWARQCIMKDIVIYKSLAVYVQYKI